MLIVCSILVLLVSVCWFCPRKIVLPRAVSWFWSRSDALFEDADADADADAGLELLLCGRCRAVGHWCTSAPGRSGVVECHKGGWAAGHRVECERLVGRRGAGAGTRVGVEAIARCCSLAGGVPVPYCWAHMSAPPSRPSSAPTTARPMYCWGRACVRAVSDPGRGDSKWLQEGQGVSMQSPGVPWSDPKLS